MNSSPFIHVHMKHSASVKPISTIFFRQNKSKAGNLKDEFASLEFNEKTQSNSLPKLISITRNASERSVRIIHPDRVSPRKTTVTQKPSNSNKSNKQTDDAVSFKTNDCKKTSAGRRYSQIEKLDDDQFSCNNEKPEKKRRYAHWYEKRCCIAFCPISILLLLSLLAALIVGLLYSNKNTTTTLSTTVTTVTSTTATTSTTTKPTCSVSCLNQTWINDTSLHARLKFENNFLDETKKYNGTGVNSPTFVTGYVGKAVSFAFNASQMVSTPYIPLGNNSFSVDAWIYPTAIINQPHNSIFGLCPNASKDYCFHGTVRFTSSVYYLYHGFYGDDTNGNAKPILTNQWVHAAFTFDLTTRIQTVYHNGISLNSKNVSSPFLGMTGDFQIGHVPRLTASTISNMFEGYIDEVSASGRAKSTCEILEQATLAARFSFDGSQPLLDNGPNSVSTSASNYAIVSARIQNGISIKSTSPSYFQASGFVPLGIANQSFSISFWIKPTSRSGTIVHQSDSSSGSGFCITYLGFASNGSLISQVLTNTGYVSIAYSDLPLTTFSHVVQTWSTTNGLTLYIDNVLIATKTAVTTQASASWVNYLTLGSCLNGCGTCNSGQVSSGQFTGIIDDFRLYSRELSATDVCALYALGFI